MKTTYRIISVLVASFCLLCACSSSLDEELTLNSYAPLTLSVSVGNYTPIGSGVQTRVANAYPFTFREGDKLGIIALQENGNIVTNYNNILFTYQNGKWAPTTALPFSSAYKYLVYYPYQEAMTGKMTKNDIIASFNPPADQSSEANHRASDLLVDLITPAATNNTLNVTFQHAFSLLVIPPVKANITSEGTAYQCVLSFTDASITAGTAVGLPYVASDGTARLVVRPQTTTFKSYLNCNGKLYSSSTSQVTLAANHCYAFKELETTFEHNFNQAQEGDFYCNTTTTSGTTGYLVPNNAVSFPSDMNCIGLVFKVGKDTSDTGTYITLNSQEISTFHGYVVALQDAGNFMWASYQMQGSLIGTSTSDSDWKGYSNCQKMKKGEGHNWAITDFPAANACITFGTSGFYPRYAAPPQSSGWFLPSPGQLSFLYSRVLLPGQINKLKTTSNHKEINWFSEAYYWSSSESGRESSLSALYVSFYNGTAYYTEKYYSTDVRSILAF